MTKLSEYAELAATEYLLETDATELNPVWIAAFFQDSGLQEEYPRQDLITFSVMVQKLLNLKAERAGKQAHAQLDKIIQLVKRPPAI